MTHFTVQTEDLVAKAAAVLREIKRRQDETWAERVERRLARRERRRKWFPWLRPWTEEDAVKSLYKDWLVRKMGYWKEEKLAKNLLGIKVPEVQISLEDWETLCSVT